MVAVKRKNGSQSRILVCEAKFQPGVLQDWELLCCRLISRLRNGRDVRVERGQDKYHIRGGVDKMRRSKSHRRAPALHSVLLQRSKPLCSGLGCERRKNILFRGSCSRGGFEGKNSST